MTRGWKEKILVDDITAKTWRIRRAVLKKKRDKKEKRSQGLGVGKVLGCVRT